MTRINSETGEVMQDTKPTGNHFAETFTEAIGKEKAIGLMEFLSGKGDGVSFTVWEEKDGGN